jgi:hypothetical protein
MDDAKKQTAPRGNQGRKEEGHTQTKDVACVFTIDLFLSGPAS